MAVFAALGWERRLVTGALVDATMTGAGRWQGRLGDGGSCVVAQTGMGPVRAAEHAGAVPRGEVLVGCGCAGGLVPWLRAGELVVASRIVALDAAGRPRASLAAESESVAAWAARRGFRVHVGPIVSAFEPLATSAAKLAAGRDGALAVDMESGALAAEAQARGVPFVAIRVVLDEVADDLGWAAESLDPATGEIRVGAALGAIATRPRMWPRAIGLARRHRVAADRLGRFLAAFFAAGQEALRPDVPPATAASR